MLKGLGSVALLLAAQLSAARADDVHLDNGSVLEGKVVRHADKVSIELESGTITLSADTVQRIDKRESHVEHFERMYAALAPSDIAGRMRLADYCRDHDMRTREQSLLREVIEREPDHADARARLGYVKGGHGWLTREEQYRAKGMVQRDGEWITRERSLELDRLRDEARAAEQRREQAQTELETQRLALRRQALELEREQRATEASQPALTTPYYVAPYGSYYGRRVGARTGRLPEPSSTRPFPINGVRDPRDTTWSLPGFRDPHEYLRTR